MVPGTKVSRRRGKYHWSRPAGRGDSGRAGFTLVELLVVIAIIALLLSILLPSLASARGAAKAAACAAQLHGCGNGLAAYGTEFNEWLPGYNTSGVAIRALRFKATSESWRLKKPKVPVQPQDWITPFLNLEGSLPDSRAERFRIATDHYKCPSQRAVQSRLYPFSGGGVPDWAEFTAMEDWVALSYLMPVHFQLWGQRQNDEPQAPMLGIPGMMVRVKAADPEWEVRVHDYVSRIGRVGAPAQKVAAADGTRYLTDQDTLDHDVSPFPTDFGSFSSSGAWWQGSTAYGVAMPGTNWDDEPITARSPSNGRNLSLSYRHGKGSSAGGSCQGNKGAINALFFDGHVKTLYDRESRKIDLWYPRGAVLQAPEEGMHKVEENYVIR
ncbi:MAG TPA: prepilin-type N-terminal cleavage/methylation domain-containing protein [Phycisphaerae bacterium]|nr:prepilin-type N-terminal cleavage/methylation domain-containing protein [Phycisphaerae bacterium]HNU44643.1 prepilin-type N-terminal cleavage/methylation domain-containing protein [Phycisphaerae bacterium]